MATQQSTIETRTYLWQCPICGTSGLGVYEISDGFRAVNALRTHIRSTDGRGHGPIHALPTNLDPKTLSTQVSRR